MSEHAVSGICDICEQEMVGVYDGFVLGKPRLVDAYHPHNVERPCPPEPRGSSHPDGYDHEGWAKFFASGQRSGRPGIIHFRFQPMPEETP